MPLQHSFDLVIIKIKILYHNATNANDVGGLWIRTLLVLWIKTLLRDQKSCVMNNGHSTGYFNLERGTRQGDPMFPL